MRLFLWFFASVSFLFSAEYAFDEKHATLITQCHGRVSPPSIYNFYNKDDWTASVFVHFDNGLHGVLYRYAKYESHAKQYAQITYEGPANIFRQKNGYFAFMKKGTSGTQYLTRLDSLWVNEYHSFGVLPVIHSMEERVEVQTSWFFGDSYLYHYTVKLSDDTVWCTAPRSRVLEKRWNFGDRILLIGSTDFPCLVNIDASLAKELSTAEYLEVFPEQ